MRAAFLTKTVTVLPVVVAGIFPVRSTAAPKGTVVLLIIIGVTGIGLVIRQGYDATCFPPF